LSEVKTWGVEGIRIACMDGLSGFPDPVRAGLSPASRRPQGAQFHEVYSLLGLIPRRFAAGILYFVQRPEKVRTGLKAVSPCMALPS
jgi:hypothetical protein